MKIRKIIIRILLVLLAVIAAVLVVRAVLNFTEGKRLARTLADLKAKGVPLTVKDLAALCPEGENGAPLWKAAEELYAFEGEDIKLFNEVYQNFVRDTPIAAETWSALARLIEKNRRVLDLIPEVAGKPCFQYRDTGVKSWEKNVKYWEKKIPNAIKTIRAARLWGFDAFLSAEKGDVRASLDRLRIGLRFAPKIAEESMLITYLIAVANAKSCLMFLNKAVSGREVSAELLLPILGDLDDRQINHWKVLLRTSIRGERVLFMDVGLPPSPAALQQAFGGKAWTERLYYWLLRPLVKRDISLNLPKYADLETRALSSYYQTRDFWKSFQGQLHGLPWYAIVSKNVLLDNMETTFMKTATLDALILTARVGLACRIFKSRTGEYPENLQALVPALLTDVPIDPFTGDPLVYRREGEGFIVYSLGSNLNDDGGRSTWEITQLVMEKDDDWTWKELW